MERPLGWDKHVPWDDYYRRDEDFRRDACFRPGEHFRLHDRFHRDDQRRESYVSQKPLNFPDSVGSPAIDEMVLIEGMEKVANRITGGLILAALIVGAALMMRIESPFHLFGYPGLAILCFMGAGGGGLILVISILMHDRSSKK
ncbi:MAG: hypothetical protein ABSD58_16235 [Verrucomicrobiia bacterium]|jgi:hypothetical protein